MSIYRKRKNILHWIAVGKVIRLKSKVASRAEKVERHIMTFFKSWFNCQQTNVI